MKTQTMTKAEQRMMKRIVVQIADWSSHSNQVQQAVDIDWHNAPAGARWWSMGRDGKACWHIMAVCAESVEFIAAVTWPAPTFGYTADWRDSLRERPASEMASSAHCLLHPAGCV